MNNGSEGYSLENVRDWIRALAARVTADKSHGYNCYNVRVRLQFGLPDGCLRPPMAKIFPWRRGFRLPSLPAVTGRLASPAKSGDIPILHSLRSLPLYLLLCLPPLLLFEISAFGQTSSIKLIGNIDQEDGGRTRHFNPYKYQTSSFRTGSNKAGYTLDKIGIIFANSCTNCDLVVTIRKVTITKSRGRPRLDSSTVYTLTGPTAQLISDIRIDYTAPENSILDANTTYWLYIENKGSSPTGSLSKAPSGNTDNSPAPGWSIGTTHYSNYKTTGFWQTEKSMKLAVYGSVIPNPHGLTLSKKSVAVAESGGKGSYTVKLDRAPTHDVTVKVQASDTDAVTFNRRGGEAILDPDPPPFQNLVFKTGNWETPQTVTIAGVDDAIDNPGGRSVKISHSVSSADPGYQDLDTDSVIVTVTDDEATKVILSGRAWDLAENTNNTGDVFTVALGRELVKGEKLTVPLTFEGSATRGSDYRVGCPSPLPKGVSCANLNSGKATVTFTGPSADKVDLTVVPQSDNVDENSETVSIGLGALDSSSGTGLDGGASGVDNLSDFNITDQKDLTAPTVASITRRSAHTDGKTNVDSLMWRVTFSEAMIDVDKSDFTVTGDDIGKVNLTVTGNRGSTSYDVTASGGSLARLDGTVTLRFAGNQDVRDRSGRILTATTPVAGAANDNTYEVDNTPPTIEISTDTTNHRTTGAFTATFTFSETMKDFVVGDVTVGNGVASAFSEDTNNAGAVWTATITPTVNGMDVTLDVASGVATDSAGNDNTLADTVFVVYTRTLEAPATFTATAGDAQVTLNWSAPSDSAGVAALSKYRYRYKVSSVSDWGNWQDVLDSADDGNELDDETSFVVTGLTNGIEYSFELSAVNEAGDGAAASVTATPVVDITAPSLSSAEGSNTTLTLTYDEALDTGSVPAGAAFTVKVNGTAVNLATSNPVAVSGSTVTLNLAGAVGIGKTVTVSYAAPTANPIQDSADNAAAGFTDKAVTVGGICDRTAAVQTAILDRIDGISDCADVTSSHLSSIASLNLSRRSLPTLQANDFNGLSSMVILRLTNSGLTSLDKDIFKGLSSLEWLWLDSNSFSSLDKDIFKGLSSLKELYLHANQLSSLDKDIFNGLSSLIKLSLGNNDLTSLDKDIFNGLSLLTSISLNKNKLTSLDKDIFDGSSSLIQINLSDNNLSNLDKDVFKNLSSLRRIYLIGNNNLTCLPKGMHNKDKINEASIKSLPDCLGVTVSPRSLKVTEGKTASYTLVLDTQPSGDVTITPSSGDIAVVTVSPTSLTFTTENWDTAQDVTVTAVMDNDAISNKATISHSISGGGYGSVTVSDVSVTATDSNAAPKVKNAILDQTATEDTAFTYTFPENTFSDRDTGDTLTYTALLSDDSALPTWLTFTPATRT
ncbi:MAG: leucine-rich repeat protein, partial [Synechococcus sp. SB0669_bin_8]|nr:leucine-rich repeat protein [Synechococcus sp. SB0669_bin_8]